MTTHDVTNLDKGWRIVLEGVDAPIGFVHQTHYYLTLQEFKSSFVVKRRWRKDLVYPAGWYDVHSLSFNLYWRYPSNDDKREKLAELIQWYHLYRETLEES